MIGKAEWFSPRKFGWGLGLKTKEGIIYIFGIALIISFVAALPLSLNLKLIAEGIVILLIVIDILDIMTKVYSKLDEREQKHQMIAERNASFVAVVCITAYIIYLVITTIPQTTALLDKISFPIGIILAMAIVKGATLIYLEQKS